MTDRLRGFPEMSWENVVIAEMADRRRERRNNSLLVTPDLAQVVADLSFTYPSLSGGVVTGMAVSGVTALSPGADQIDARNDALTAAGFSVPTPRAGFWDHGLGKGIKGFTRVATTIFQSLYDEVTKGITSTVYGFGQGLGPLEAGRGSFGQSTGALAAAIALQGQPVNLGSGFFPGGDLSPETEAALAEGVPFMEAIQNPAQMAIGIPIAGFSHSVRQKKGLKIAGTEDIIDERSGMQGLLVTPGRVVASVVSEPGTNAFNNFSGLVDFAANIFLDPANTVPFGLVADIRKANKALVGGTRPTVIARNIDKWLDSRHGRNTTQYFADTDDFLTLHGLFRKNAPKSNVDVKVVEAIRSTDDPAVVKQILSDMGHGGTGGSGALTELPVKQGLIGRMTQTSGLAGILAQGMGKSGKVVDVSGLRAMMTRNRKATSLMSRLSAEVGTTSLRVDNLNTSVDDFGQWMQAAGFKKERMGYHMSRMAQIKPGGIETGPEMWGVVKAAYTELGEQLIKDGIPKPIALAFTKAFNTVEEYRKFWQDNAGHPMLFAGSRYNVMTNGKVSAIPTAELFSEFLDWTIPLLDMRKIRRALNRASWSRRGFEQAAQKRIKGQFKDDKLLPRFSLETMTDWDDLGPSVAGALLDTTIQRVWKPLVLLRVAWPVRVIAEEQVRMLAVGMDNIYNHPLHGMMLMFNKGYRKGFQATDVAGKNFEDAVAFRNAMSRRGIEYGLGTKRNIFSGEWLDKKKGDPEYFDGWVIQLQQLADDPIIARIARSLIEDPDTDVGVLLKAIKDEFSKPGTEMGNLRRALSVDASNWDLLKIRSMADAVIDDRYARLLQMTGGDFVKFDHVRGNLVDSFQNKLDFDPVTNTYRTASGEEIILNDPPSTGRPTIAMTQVADDLEDLVSGSLAEITNAAAAARFADPQAPVRLIADPGTIEEWATALDRLDSVLRAGERANNGRWVDQLYNDFIDPRELATRLRAERGGLLADDSLVTGPLAVDIQDNLTPMLRSAQRDAVQYSDLTGRARQDAADIIGMSGNRNPEGIRAVHAGYTPGPGQKSIDEIAEMPGWSLEEISDMIRGDIEFGNFNVTRLTPEYRAAGASEEGTSIFHIPVHERQDAIFISHDGFVTGKILLRRDPDTGKVVDVDMFHVAKGDGRTIWYDPDKAQSLMSKGEAEEAARRQLRDAGDDIKTPEEMRPHGFNEEYIAPGGNTDAYLLMKYIVSPPKGSGLTPIDTQDIYDLAFGGVPIREWFRASGISDEILDGQPVLSLNDIAEFMRVQHGAAWAGPTGPMGRIPAISLSADGAHSLAKAVLAMGDGGSIARRIFDEDLSKSAMGWPQRHVGTQAVRAPDPELLEAVATGTLRGKTLSFRDVLDEKGRVAKINELSIELRKGWGGDAGTTNIGPEHVKVAAPADESKLDSAVDHLFDWMMSRPTNTLSRSPAFKQFYWRRVSEMLVYMDAPTRKLAIANAKKAGISKRKLDSMADDFVSKRARFTEAADDITNLDDVDDIAKAFALHETKRLLYDLTKKTQFFDITRNIFPFGEAWYEIMTTWARLIGENPRVLRRFQQGIQGARQEGFFYNDPTTDEEVFAMPHMKLLGKVVGGLPGFADPEGLGDPTEGGPQARPQYSGRVDGVNLALNNYLPGLGPLIQMPLGTFARDFMERPEMRWARDLVFPFGFTDAKDPGALVNSVMPAWFRKGMTALGRPTGDDQRLFNNTVIDVLRAMELNQEIPPGMSAEAESEVIEIARSRARTIFAIRSLQQFIGPTGANVRWDVEIDKTGEAFAYQVLATDYRQMIEDNDGDRVQAFFDFVNLYGFDPAGIATAKTEQVRPRSVVEEGLDFQNANESLFERYELTAYYAAPDSPDGQFDYNAYLNQLRNDDRVGLTPEQWNTERNRLLGSIQYERVRRAAVDAGIRNKPEVAAYLRARRFNLMEQYPGYGFANIGVVTNPEQRQFMAEFERWRDDSQLSATQAGAGLSKYLLIRERVLGLAASQFGISEDGFANAKSSAILREYLLGVGTRLMSQHPDFGVIFQRHYLWEVEEAEPVAPETLLGVDLGEIGGEA